MLGSKKLKAFNVLLVILLSSMSVAAAPKGGGMVKVLVAQNASFVGVDKKPTRLVSGMILLGSINIIVKEGGAYCIKDLSTGNFFVLYCSGRPKDLINSKKHTTTSMLGAYFKSLESDENDVNKWCHGGVYRDISEESDEETTIEYLKRLLIENGADDNVKITLVGDKKMKLDVDGSPALTQ